MSKIRAALLDVSPRSMRAATEAMATAARPAPKPEEAKRQAAAALADGFEGPPRSRLAKGVEGEGVDLKYVSNDDSWGTRIWSKLTGQPRGPQTLPEYVERAVEDAGGKPIRSIELCGHGNEGVQNIGPHGQPGANLRSPLTPEQREAFRRLGEAMAPDGKIVLGGCNVARGPEGRKLMQEIAEASGRAVEAGESTQLPTSGIEGRKVTVYPDGRPPTVTESPTGTVYDKLADLFERGCDWATQRR